MLDKVERWLPSRLWLWLIAIVFAFDQITKLLSDALLELHQPLSVFPGFNLTLAYNTGASFSLLSDAGGWQRWFFIAVACLIVVILWRALLHTQSRSDAMGFTLIIAGALGNLADRVLYGYVIDFIEVYYRHWSWPIFNVADSAVCIGALFILLGLWRKN